jgi:glutamate synthase domain-containing protein 1
MCGIAGIIHRGAKTNIGAEMTSMLQALKHRGPDSTGYAFYGQPADNEFVMRCKVAEGEDINSGFNIHQQIKDRKTALEQRMSELGVLIIKQEDVTEYAFRYQINYGGDLKALIDFIEDIENVEILSVGKSLELVKDLGDASDVSKRYGLENFNGSHAIGHTRMATESDVDIRSAHPYWAYPFNDVSLVHNGQLTNYWTFRRALERRGHRFLSDCDSELIAVYVADRIDQGDELEEAMTRSINELDGVFTYVVATQDALGMAKDVMAAKPMVLYEADDLVVLASEEVAIRSIFPHEIDTYDPYEGEVKVWRT